MLKHLQNINRETFTSSREDNFGDKWTGELLFIRKFFCWSVIPVAFHLKKLLKIVLVSIVLYRNKVN